MCIGMTEITGKGCVFAWAGDHLLFGTGVTRDTNFLVLAFETNFQRLMRVVTTETIFNFVVSTTFVAGITLWNVVFHARAMPFMTSLTVDLRTVGRTICSNLSRLLGVTFGTISNSEYRLLGQRNGTQTRNKC